MIERNLITFLTMVEEGNTVKCAEKLHLTQPAVTQHLHTLEETYGAKLFIKAGRKLTLTEKGKLFYDMVHRLYTMEQQITYRMQTMPQTPIRFGATRSINAGVMPYIIADFLDRFSDRPVEMTVQNTAVLLSYLEKGKIDFALLEGNFDHSKYESHAFMNADFVGLCKSGGKYSHCESLKDTFSAPLLLREPGSGSRDILEKTLQARGYDLYHFQGIYQFESIPVILELVKKDFGITFAYKQGAKKEIEQGDIAVLDESVLHLYRQFWFVTLPSSPFLDESLEVLAYLQQLVEKYLQQ